MKSVRDKKSGGRRPPPGEKPPEKPAAKAAATLAEKPPVTPGTKPAEKPAGEEGGEALPDEAATGGATDLAPVVGQNLRRLRTRRGLSLERLSRASGVSRAMLGQIELGQSAPTINVLWKISRALDVPFSALISTAFAGGTTVLKAAQARRLTSYDGSFSSRALFPFGEPRRVEFYELRLAARSVEEAEAHAPGTQENLVVSRGAVEIALGGRTHALGAGDAIVFAADVPHAYRNRGDEEAVMYLVMTYAETVG